MSVLDRSAQPASGALRDFSFPVVDRKALGNGLDLRLARMNRLPMVNVSLFMRASESALTHDRAGLAVLTSDALEGGTRKRNRSSLSSVTRSRPKSSAPSP